MLYWPFVIIIIIIISVSNLSLLSSNRLNLLNDSHLLKEMKLTHLNQATEKKEKETTKTPYGNCFSIQASSTWNMHLIYMLFQLKNKNGRTTHEMYNVLLFFILVYFECLTFKKVSWTKYIYNSRYKSIWHWKKIAFNLNLCWKIEIKFIINLI